MLWIRLVFWPTLALVLIALTTLIVSGIALVPATLMLGPCLKDFTGAFWEPRESPLTSTTFDVGEGAVRVCYGKPSARGREVFGGMVPYRQLWRTGANEPTRIYSNRAFEIAGVSLPPGRYAMYSIPDTSEWRIFITKPVGEWRDDLLSGAPDRVIGVGVVPADTTADYVESFTISGRPEGDSAVMVLEWEWTRVTVGVKPFDH